MPWPFSKAQPPPPPPPPGPTPDTTLDATTSQGPSLQRRIAGTLLLAGGASVLMTSLTVRWLRRRLDTGPQLSPSAHIPRTLQRNAVPAHALRNFPSKTKPNLWSELRLSKAARNQQSVAAARGVPSASLKSLYNKKPEPAQSEFWLSNEHIESTAQPPSPTPLLDRILPNDGPLTAVIAFACATVLTFTAFSASILYLAVRWDTPDPELFLVVLTKKLTHHLTNIKASGTHIVHSLFPTLAEQSARLHAPPDTSSVDPGLQEFVSYVNSLFDSSHTPDERVQAIVDKQKKREDLWREYLEKHPNPW